MPASLLAPFGLKVALLVLPEDETALWLISADGNAAARTMLPPELDLPGLIGTSTAFAGGHVMQRQDGRPHHPRRGSGRLAGSACPGRQLVITNLLKVNIELNIGAIYQLRAAAAARVGQ